MPSYVARALKKFDHPAPLRPQHAPHQRSAPIYGSCKPQVPTPDSNAQPLDKQGTTWHLHVLWPRMRPLYSPSTQRNRIRTGLPNDRHHRPNHHAHGLPPHVPTRRAPLLRQRYDPQNHVGCRLSRPTKSTQLCNRALPPWLAQQQTNQRPSRRLMQNHQKRCVLRSRSRNRKHLHERPTRLSNAHRSNRTRPPSTHHRRTFRDRQQYCPRHPHFKNATETFEILRHALLVDEGPHQPGPIQSHLGLRQIQLGRLLHQASPTMASSQHALQIHSASQLSAQHNKQVSVRGCVSSSANLTRKLRNSIHTDNSTQQIP